MDLPIIKKFNKHLMQITKYSSSKVLLLEACKLKQIFTQQYISTMSIIIMFPDWGSCYVSPQPVRSFFFFLKKTCNSMLSLVIFANPLWLLLLPSGIFPNCLSSCSRHGISAETSKAFPWHVTGRVGWFEWINYLSFLQMTLLLIHRSITSVCFAAASCC